MTFFVSSGSYPPTRAPKTWGEKVLGGETDFKLLFPTKRNSVDSGEKLFAEPTNKSLLSCSPKNPEGVAKEKSPLLDRDFMNKPEPREIRQNKKTETTPKQRQGVLTSPLENLKNLENRLYISSFKIRFSPLPVKVYATINQ